MPIAAKMTTPPETTLAMMGELTWLLGVDSDGVFSVVRIVGNGGKNLDVPAK